MMYRSFFLIILTLLCCLQKSQADTCKHRLANSKAQVLDVTHHGTLILSDNRTVRLAGMKLPHVSHGSSDNNNRPGGQESYQAIRQLLIGKNVQLHLSDLRRDRYGIWPAHVYLVNGQGKVWVQSKLIALGVAQVSAIGNRFECVKELLKAERKARDAETGLWRNEIYMPRSAEDVWGLIRLVDRFQIVEGKIVNVAEVRGRVYLNFGRNWRRDFTVKISRSHWKRFQKRGIALNDYLGKRVRVRGWVRLRNGPLIEIEHPDLIEIVGVAEDKDQNVTSVSTDW